jgi:asparagine synthase (glutamine-hydrolysing)
MCGIAGILQNDLSRTPDKEALERMASVLEHRGPDGVGFFAESGIGLAHRRLAILDLVSGNQPMFSADGRIAIVFNGEIYNYLELRKELQGLGSAFKTASDTEVLLEAYRIWGTACVNRLNGMWAFALWDHERKRLFCSRDRLGEKPFYYTKTNDAFVFASEIKSLFAYGVRKEFDYELLDAYLSLTYIPAPWTGFKNVKKLPPGHSLLLTGDALSVFPFWDLPRIPEHDQRRDGIRIVEEFRHIFHDAVRIRMRSDVPYGAFLSGGVDSAAVVAAMSQLSSVPVRTCTVGFPPPAVDERADALAIAQLFRTSHVERLVNAEDAAETIELLAWHFDEPFGDTSSLPTYLISKAARQLVKMVLTGDGGDEVFAGYTIYQGEKIANALQVLPKRVRDFLPALVAFGRHGLPAGLSDHPTARILRTLQSAGLPFPERLIQKQVGISHTARARLLRGVPGVRPTIDLVHELLAPVAEAHPMVQLQYWLTKYSLADDMLCKVDRSSMAAGLEARAPFLDFRIIELLGSTHCSVKMPGLRRKHLLRIAMRGILPNSTLNRKKRGFNIPAGVLLKPAGGDFLRQRARACGAQGLLNEIELDRYLANPRESGSRVDSHVWMLAMLSYCM